jgi:hypothetical protein
VVSGPAVGESLMVDFSAAAETKFPPGGVWRQYQAATFPATDPDLDLSVHSNYVYPYAFPSFDPPPSENP